MPNMLQHYRYDVLKPTQRYAVIAHSLAGYECYKGGMTIKLLECGKGNNHDRLTMI